MLTECYNCFVARLLYTCSKYKMPLLVAVNLPIPSAKYSEPQSQNAFVMNSRKEKQLFPWPRHQKITQPKSMTWPPTTIEFLGQEPVTNSETQGTQLLEAALLTPCLVQFKSTFYQIQSILLSKLKRKIRHLVYYHYEFTSTTIPYDSYRPPPHKT